MSFASSAHRSHPLHPAQSCRVRPARRAVPLAAARVARLMVEGLEGRRLLATVNGTPGNDVIVAEIIGANIVVTVNGTPNNFSDAANATIIVNAGDGNDTVTIAETGANATTVNGGIGNDSVLVGGNDYDAQIDATVRVNGDAGEDTLQIDDDGDLAGDGSELSVLNGGSFDEPNAAATTFGTIDNFQYFGGPGGERFVLDNTILGVPVTIATGDGNDSIQIGAGDYEVDIDSPVFVNAGAGVDTLEVEDGSDTGDDTYTQDTTFTKNTANAAADLSQTFVERFEISGPVGVANNTFNINRIVAGVLIVVGAGDGNDTVNVGNGDFDANLFRVSVLGDGGADVLNFNDQASPAGSDVYDIVTDGILKNNSTNNVAYYDSTTESVVINGSANPDLYNINSTFAGINITINAGDGDDTLNGAGPNGPFVNDLDNSIANNTVFNGGVGTDSVILDDVGDGNEPESYFLSGTQFFKGSGQLAFGTTERFDLRANGGNNALTYGPFLGGQNATVDGGAGNDTVTSTNINNEVFPLANVLVEGGAGTDAWVVDDTVDVTATAYRLTSTTLQVTAGTTSGPIGYNTFESISITTNNNGTNFDLDSYGTTPLTLNLADGDDTLTIGGGDLDTNIDTNLTVNGGAGSDRIVVDDSADSAGTDTLELTNGLISKGLGPRTVAHVAFEGQRYFGNANDTVISLNSAAIPTTISGGAGNEFLSVAPAGDDIDAVSAGLVFTGGAGADTVSFNDSLDLGDDTYTLTATAFTKTASGGAFGGFSYDGLERLGISAGVADHTFTLNSLDAGVTYPLNGGDGNDTFDVNGGDGASFLLGTALLNGGGGTDALRFNDGFATTGRVWRFEDTVVDRPDTAPINYSAFESAVLNAGAGPDDILVTKTLASTPVTINAGAGFDTVQIGDGGATVGINGALRVDGGLDGDLITAGAGDLDELVAPVVLDGDTGGAGTDRFVIDDSADAGSLATNYAIFDDVFSRTGAGTTFGGITFLNETTVLFDLNQSGTPILVNDVAGGSGISGGIIRANGGVDTITIVEAPETITVRGGAGDDSIDINADGGGIANVAFDENEVFGGITNRAGGLLTLRGDVAVTTDNNTSIAGGSSGVINVDRGTLVLPAFNAGLYVDALERGFNGGAWNGSSNGSFRSSTAAATALGDALGYATIGVGASQLNVTNVHGVPVSAGDFVVTYTLAGDTDLNRAVGFVDLVTLAQNYAPAIGGKNWRQGNFNYNTPDTAVGAVGFADLVALAQNYNQSVLSLAPEPGRALASRDEDPMLA